MGALVKRWHGPTWTALLTRERYGLHFSVSARGRDATDDEVDAAMTGYAFQLEPPLVEITHAHRAIGAINPYVRHFVPEEEAMRMFTRAAELP